MAEHRRNPGDDLGSPRMSTPEVSVVIPTYRREARLRFALEGLAEQSLATDRFEAIVVRTPNSAPPLAEAPEGLNVRFLESSQTGPAAQRNAGWRAAAGSLVAFMDDDCRPAPAWLERAIADAGPGTVLQGRTEPDPDELHLLFGLARTMRVDGVSELFPTCNIVYPRRLLEQLDGFDETFTAPWGEDTDLGQRALAAGASARFSSDALVWHAVLPNPLPDALRTARRRRWLPVVIARHPHLRSDLLGRVFVNRTHATLATALAGALLPASGLRRAAWLPYFLNLLAGHARGAAITPRGIARLALHLPVRLLVDVVEVGSTVEGAIRARTPVI